MSAQSLIHHGAERRLPRRVRRNGLVQLGWPHFWLLSSILAGMLSLVATIFLAHLLAR